jgi:hypothetical protein
METPDGVNELGEPLQLCALVYSRVGAAMSRDKLARDLGAEGNGLSREAPHDDLLQAAHASVDIFLFGFVGSLLLGRLPRVACSRYKDMARNVRHLAFDKKATLEQI